VGDLGFGGGFDGDVGDDALVSVDGLVGVGRADGFENGFVNGAGFRMNAARRGERIDDEVNLAEIGANGVGRLLLDLVGEGVAVDVFGVETGGASGVSEADGVIPAGRGGPTFLGRAFEKHANGRRAGAKG